MAAKKEPPSSTAHRQYGVTDDHAEWCRVVINFDDRHDSVPSLNGVEVGQFWRNIHVGVVERVVEIRLAGLGTHTAHYESILLAEDGVDDPYGQFNISGTSLTSIRTCWEQVELVDESWCRVEPQPYVWATEDRSEDALVGRVRHDRPHGDPLSWAGKRGAKLHLYANGVLTCDGLTLASFKGMSGKHTYTRIMEQFPFAKPSGSMRKVLPAALASRSVIAG